MTGTILDKIIDAKRTRVSIAKRVRSVEFLRDLAADRQNTLCAKRFLTAISDPARINIIAEFKRASPSRGRISDSFEPAEVASIYENAGAAALSVLTEEDFFAGSLEDLARVKETVSVPVLRKDFIIDEYQILESAAAGADAILLIVAALSPTEVKHYLGVAGQRGLDVLVEVHDREELDIALDCGAEIIGINNRNLKTFKVSLEVSESIIQIAPSDKVMVAESGITTFDEVRRLREAGFSAFLVGEGLMRSDDPAAALRELLGSTLASGSGMGKLTNK